MNEKRTLELPEGATCYRVKGYISIAAPASTTWTFASHVGWDPSPLNPAEPIILPWKIDARAAINSDDSDRHHLPADKPAATLTLDQFVAACDQLGFGSLKRYVLGLQEQKGKE